MRDKAAVEPRKRILFIWAVLGIMVGVSAYLLYKALQSENYALLAVLPALALTAIPMVRSLVSLKSELDSKQ